MVAVVPPIKDIERYLGMRLKKDTTPGAMDGNLRAEILEVTSRKISQM